MKTISFIHQRGLSCGPIQLTDIHINARYWIQLKPRFQSCLATMEFNSDCNITGLCANDDDYHIHSSSHPGSRRNSVRRASFPTRKPRQTDQYEESSVTTTTTTIVSPSRATISNSPIYHVEHRYETYCRTHIDIVELIKEWQLGHISNFDYLLILNALAGRKLHDPNNHLIFPWINDLTSSTSNLRDLSQSKYRLNKGTFGESSYLIIYRTASYLGDAQLDLTYNYYSTAILSTTNIVPHHLSEHLSSITYYVYKARRTEKRILCEVRDDIGVVFVDYVVFNDRMFGQFGCRMNIPHRLDDCIFGHRKNVFLNFSMIHRYFNQFMMIYRIYRYRIGVQVQVGRWI